jgi:hypothetical protein
MNKRPVRRGYCKDCHADFALHRAIRRFAHTIPSDDEGDLYFCPECDSYAVEEVCLEQEAQ